MMGLDGKQLNKKHTLSGPLLRGGDIVRDAVRIFCGAAADASGSVSGVVAAFNIKKGAVKFPFEIGEQLVEGVQPVEMTVI